MAPIAMVLLLCALLLCSSPLPVVALDDGDSSSSSSGGDIHDDGSSSGLSTGDHSFFSSSSSGAVDWRSSSSGSGSTSETEATTTAMFALSSSSSGPAASSTGDDLAPSSTGSDAGSSGASESEGSSGASNCNECMTCLHGGSTCADAALNSTSSSDSSGSVECRCHCPVGFYGRHCETGVLACVSCVWSAPNSSVVDVQSDAHTVALLVAGMERAASILIAPGAGLAPPSGWADDAHAGTDVTNASASASALAAPRNRTEGASFDPFTVSPGPATGSFSIRHVDDSDPAVAWARGQAVGMAALDALERALRAGTVQLLSFTLHPLRLYSDDGSDAPVGFLRMRIQMEAAGAVGTEGAAYEWRRLLYVSPFSSRCAPSASVASDLGSHWRPSAWTPLSITWWDSRASAAAATPPLVGLPTEPGPCEPCPEGAVCPGRALALPRHGWWSPSPWVAPYECAWINACPGSIAAGVGAAAVGLSFEQLEASIVSHGEPGQFGSDDALALGADRSLAASSFPSPLPLSSSCSRGYEGFLCARCSSDFFMQSQQCLPCSGSLLGRSRVTALVVLAVCAGVLFGLVLLVVAAPVRVLAHALPAILLLQQVLILVRGASSHAAFRSSSLDGGDDAGEYGELFDVVHWGGVLLLDLESLRLGCADLLPALDAFQMLYATCALLVGLLLLLCPCAWAWAAWISPIKLEVWYSRRRKIQRCTRLLAEPAFRRRLLHSAACMLTLAYVRVAIVVAGLFHCKPGPGLDAASEAGLAPSTRSSLWTLRALAEDEEWFLVSDPSLRCYTRDHVLAMCVGGVVGLCVLVLFPLGLLRRLTRLHSPFLTHPYNEDNKSVLGRMLVSEFWPAACGVRCCRSTRTNPTPLGAPAGSDGGGWGASGDDSADAADATYSPDRHRDELLADDLLYSTGELSRCWRRRKRNFEPDREALTNILARAQEEAEIKRAKQREREEEEAEMAARKHALALQLHSATSIPMQFDSNSKLLLHPAADGGGRGKKGAQARGGGGSGGGGGGGGNDSDRRPQPVSPSIVISPPSPREGEAPRPGSAHLPSPQPPSPSGHGEAALSVHVRINSSAPSTSASASSSSSSPTPPSVLPFSPPPPPPSPPGVPAPPFDDSRSQQQQELTASASLPPVKSSRSKKYVVERLEAASPSRDHDDESQRGAALLSLPSGAHAPRSERSHSKQRSRASASVAPSTGHDNADVVEAAAATAAAVGSLFAHDAEAIAAEVAASFGAPDGGDGGADLAALDSIQAPAALADRRTSVVFQRSLAREAETQLELSVLFASTASLIEVTRQLTRTPAGALLAAHREAHQLLPAWLHETRSEAYAFRMGFYLHMLAFAVIHTCFSHDLTWRTLLLGCVLLFQEYALMVQRPFRSVRTNVTYVVVHTAVAGTPVICVLYHLDTEWSWIGMWALALLCAGALALSALVLAYGDRLGSREARIWDEFLLHPSDYPTAAMLRREEEAWVRRGLEAEQNKRMMMAATERATKAIWERIARAQAKEDAAVAAAVAAKAERKRRKAAANAQAEADEREKVAAQEAEKEKKMKALRAQALALQAKSKPPPAASAAAAAAAVAAAAPSPSPSPAPAPAPTPISSPSPSVASQWTHPHPRMTRRSDRVPSGTRRIRQSAFTCVFAIEPEAGAAQANGTNQPGQSQPQQQQQDGMGQPALPSPAPRSPSMQAPVQPHVELVNLSATAAAAPLPGVPDAGDADVRDEQSGAAASSPSPPGAQPAATAAAAAPVWKFFAPQLSAPSPLPPAARPLSPLASPTPPKKPLPKLTAAPLSQAPRHAHALAVPSSGAAPLAVGQTPRARFEAAQALREEEERRQAAAGAAAAAARPVA